MRTEILPHPSVPDMFILAVNVKVEIADFTKRDEECLVLDGGAVRLFFPEGPNLRMAIGLHRRDELDPKALADAGF